MVYNTENLDELMVRSYNVHYYINDSELSHTMLDENLLLLLLFKSNLVSLFCLIQILVLKTWTNLPYFYSIIVEKQSIVNLFKHQKRQI